MFFYLIASTSAARILAVDATPIAQGVDWNTLIPLVTAVLAGMLIPAANAFLKGAWQALQTRRARKHLQKHESIKLLGEEVVAKHSRYYVKPNCSNVDPEGEGELRAVVDMVEPLFDRLDRFLDGSEQDSTVRHALILASSGMGKTSLLLNYWVHNGTRPRKKRHRIVIAPLSDDRAVEHLKSVPDPSRAVAFIDALDEDPKARLDVKARLAELLDVCRDYRRVVVTCRTQFFERDEAIPTRTGIMQTGPVGLDGKEYKLYKLYVLPFTKLEERRYIAKRFPFGRRSARRKATELIAQVNNLWMRPMLLATLPELIDRSDPSQLKYSHQVYERLIAGWIERESDYVERDALEKFSKMVALELFGRQARQKNERLPKEEISKLAALWNIELETWQLTGRSLLVRNSAGEWQFAHRSIFEYLCAVQGIVLLTQVRDLTRSDANTATPLTDQICQFICEMAHVGSIDIHSDLLAQIPPAWRRCFEVDVAVVAAGHRKSFAFALLRHAMLRDIGLQRTDLRFADLTGANLERADLRSAKLRGAKLRDAKLAHANLGGTDLQSADLEHAYLNDTNFQGANLRGANLQSAILQGAQLQRAILQDAGLGATNLQNADLSGANFQGAMLQGAMLQGAMLDTTNFQGANLQGAKLQGANLARANLRDAILTDTDLRGANLVGTNVEGTYLGDAYLERATLPR